VSGCQVVIEPMDEGGVRVAVGGELAGSSAYTLDSELRRVEATRPARLLLDLSALAFIDSAGLARLLAAHRRAQREGRRLIVVQGTGAVRRLLALTALDHQLELFADAGAAAAAAHA
jgi:anti-anti-sigma factor